MTQQYVSSIVSLYGDSDNVSKDVKTLNEILNRQGKDLLLDVVAEYIGQTSLRFKLNSDELLIVRNKTLEHLENAIDERI